MRPVVEIAGFCLALNVAAAGLSFMHGAASEMNVHILIGSAIVLLGTAVGRVWVPSTSGYGVGLVALSIWASVTSPSTAESAWISRTAMVASAAWYCTALMQPTMQFIVLHVTVAIAALGVASNPVGKLIIDRLIQTHLAEVKKPAAAAKGSFWTAK